MSTTAQKKMLTTALIAVAAIAIVNRVAPAKKIVFGG